MLAVLVLLAIGSYQSQELRNNVNDDSTTNLPAVLSSSSGEQLESLEIKGRAPKTGYDRDLFSSGWAVIDSCDMRNFILARDMMGEVLDDDNCTVLSGALNDPYVGKSILFQRGKLTSAEVQIDHVVAVSDAWQKGAQTMDQLTRYEFYNDPDNLLAVDGPANQQKGDGDAATWLPENKTYRCEYVSKQIFVKTKYNLWVTRSEYDAMAKILNDC